MVLLDTPDWFGNTIFCDDIRQEFDGKVTFVGTYSGVMIVHVPFPLLLPKFGFGISFSQKKSLFVPNLTLRIFLPGDADDAPSIQTDTSEVSAGAAAQQAAMNSPLPSPDQKFIGLRANLIFSPLTITQPGWIKVRIVRGDDMIRLGSLAVLSRQSAQPTAESL